MKKILALAAVLIAVAVVLTGCGMPSCGGDTATSALMSDKPWDNLYNYEKSTYAVERCGAKPDGNSWTADGTDVRAEGTYTVEIYTVEGDIATWNGADMNALVPAYFEEYIARRIENGELSSASGAYSLLVAEYTLTYTDNEANGGYKGKTDTLKSVALFRNIDMSPVFSYKTADLGASGIQYTAFADYLGGTNRFTVGGSEETVTEIESNTDNETLYLYARAQTGLTEGLSTSVTVHNSVETGVYNDEAVHTMGISVTTGATLYGVDAEKSLSFIPEYVGDDVPFITAEEAEASEDTDDKAGYAFPVNQAVIYRSDTDMGTSATLLFSDTDFGLLDAKTSNVLMQITTHENDPETAEPSTITIANISDYTIRQ